MIYVDFSFAGQPPSPFLRLARRLLSICANSATCERLWSVFGATLTKLRNRLGVDTLTALSELKMHIRDEHLRKDTKTRLKRRFATRSTSAAAPAAPEPPPAPDSRFSDDETESIAAGSPANPTEQPAPNDRFRDMATRHINSVLEDETDQESVRASSVIGRPLKLVELFNFGEAHWVRLYENAARRSFDEELAMYELLDLDAEGEEEADIDVDDSTGEILLG